MNGREMRAIGLTLAGLAGTVAVQAQEVHKCTINGAVSYQARPCASGDVVLPPPPTPSDQETRQARSDLSRQRYEAATGRIVRPAYVPPPPPPPPATSTSTTTTTIIVLQSKHRVIIRETRAEPPAPPPRSLNNCEKLNQDNDEAVDRRDQLRAPSELASHAELLHKAESDVSRIAQLATASNCRLKR